MVLYSSSSSLLEYQIFNLFCSPSMLVCRKFSISKAIFGESFGGLTLLGLFFSPWTPSLSYRINQLVDHVLLLSSSLAALAGITPFHLTLRTSKSHSFTFGSDSLLYRYDDSLLLGAIQSKIQCCRLISLLETYDASVKMMSPYLC